MKKTLHTMVCRTLLVLACVLTTNAAWADTWTVTGSSIGNDNGGLDDPLFGKTWTPNTPANDMEYVDGLYTWSKSHVLLNHDIYFKICKNHAWDEAYPGENYYVGITSGYFYDITITFNADSKEINCVATKLPDEFTVAGATNGVTTDGQEDLFFGL